MNEKDVFEIKQVNEENGNDEVDEDERIYDEGDGYNGNVELLTIDLLGNIKK